MKNPRVGKAAASLLAACVLLSACGGSEGDGADTGDAVATSATDSTKSHVLVQMTGLLLIVPPATAGDSVQVYLPPPRGIEDHTAVLGFAVPDGDTVPAGLCNTTIAADTTGICYVVLGKRTGQWSLLPLGAGGSTPTVAHSNYPSEDSSGLLNVSALAGGQHKAFRSRAGRRSASTVTFLSGQLVDSLACKLAKWSYRVVDQQGNPRPEQRNRLSNVVVWEMRDLDSLVLVFRDSGGRVERVRFPPGDNSLLLAHIPTPELAHLPPQKADSVIRSPMAHFDPFYDLLSRSSSGNDSIPHGNVQRRRIPTLVDGDSVPCPVLLQSGQKRVGEPRSMATYACMPGIGSGG